VGQSPLEYRAHQPNKRSAELYALFGVNQEKRSKKKRREFYDLIKFMELLC
jgi:hypothetical protein